MSQSTEPTASSILVPRVAAVGASVGPTVEADLRAAGFDGQIRRMNLNECSYPPAPGVVAAVQEVITGANRYPDNKFQRLRAAMAADMGVEEQQIFYANGSDTILQAIGEMCIDPGLSAIVPDPSFLRYTLTVKLQGGRVDPVPVAQDGRNDVAAMLAAVKADTRVMVVASPNNPTGQMLNAGEVIELAQNTPAHVLLVIDEAYSEFARREGGPDCVRVLVEHRGKRPWTVLRTFSKAYGLAGMRVGYAIAGSEDVMDGYDRVRTAFNLSGVAQAAAHAAYLDQDYCRQLVDKVARERERLVAGLKALGREPLPSVANFVAVEMPGPGGLMVEALKAQGILIQGIRTPTPGFENFIRITLGLPEDNDACLAAIAAELASGKLYPATA